MSETIFRGPGFQDCYIAMPDNGIVYMLSRPVSVNDDLTVEGVVEVYDGSPINVCHGEDVVGTVENSGVFTRQFTASHDGTEFTLVATGACAHRLGYLQIAKT